MDNKEIRPTTAAYRMVFIGDFLCMVYQFLLGQTQGHGSGQPILCLHVDGLDMVNSFFHQYSQTPNYRVVTSASHLLRA